MSWVAGIDFSSKAIDVVFIEDDDESPPHWERYELAGEDAFDRTRTVADVMPPRYGLVWEDVVAIGIEHPAGKFGTGSMMRVQGAVLACLPTGVLVQPWPPAAWRKAVGLSGKATKDDVAAWVVTECDSFPLHPDDASLDTWPQDAFDALCIALATRQAIERKAA